MRRIALVPLCVASLIGCATHEPSTTPASPAVADARAAPSLRNAPELPRAVPFTETVFGHEIDDPYRWMEDKANAEELRAWILTQSTHAREQLASLPGRAALATMLDQTTRAGVAYADVQQAGELLFARRLDVDAPLPKLVVRDRSGQERVLLDPNAPDASNPGAVSHPAAINSYSPSPSGAVVAIHRADGGGEVGAIRFLRVADGEWLPDVLEPVWGEIGANWLNETQVLYTRMSENPSDDTSQNMSVRLRRLGTPASEDVLLLGSTATFPPKIAAVEFPLAFVVPRSNWTMALASGARADARVFAIRNSDLRATPPRWRTLAGYDDQIASFDVHDDALYYVTTKQQPNGELRRLALADGTLATSQPVLAASDAVLVGVAASRDGVYVRTLRDGVNGLLFLPDGRAPAKVVDLPLATISSLSATSDGSGVVFTVMQWHRARRYLIVEAGVARESGLASATWEGAGDYEALSEVATSADGTQVPMTILFKRGLARDGRRPTFLDGYGSYGEPTTPYYDAKRYPWLEHGGVSAECGVRGGGEKGRAWHEAGRSANKPNAHADFIACAERLIALKFTSPPHLAISGTSGGGLLAPPAGLKRPDLFKVVVPRVAVINPSRLAVANNGPNQFAEMGDPTTEAGFNALVAQDAYLMLEQANASPDWFLTIGLTDRRVDPWMSAKFAARALQRFGDHQLVFVRSDAEAGHGIGSTRDQRNEEWLDTMSFLLNRFGDPEFQMPR